MEDKNTKLILDEIKYLRGDMDARFDGVDKRLDGVDKKFIRIEKKFDRVYLDIENLAIATQNQFEVIDSKIDELSVNFGREINRLDIRINGAYKAIDSLSS